MERLAGLYLGAALLAMIAIFVPSNQQTDHQTDGQLLVLTVDDRGTRLEGACLQITGRRDPPRRICDNDAHDAEPIVGLVRITDVQGAYQVRVLTPPPGYALADAMQRSKQVVIATEGTTRLQFQFH